jgi:hypothetical protein
VKAARAAPQIPAPVRLKVAPTARAARPVRACTDCRPA